MNSRERQASRALRTIGEGRFVAFLRAAAVEPGCSAVGFFLNELGSGHPVKSIFVTGDPFGFSLSVEERPDGAWHVAFGCLAGPLAGDGGEWTVRFDESGSVSSIEAGAFWIS
jgi:hypothetical protein